MGNCCMLLLSKQLNDLFAPQDAALMSDCCMEFLWVCWVTLVLTAYGVYWLLFCSECDLVTF